MLSPNNKHTKSKKEEIIKVTPKNSTVKNLLSCSLPLIPLLNLNTYLKLFISQNTAKLKVRILQHKLSNYILTIIICQYFLKIFFY